MNKKNIFICVSLLVYSIATMSEESVALEAPISSVAAEYQPRLLSEICADGFQLIMANAQACNKFLRAQYDDFMKEPEKPKPIGKTFQPLAQLKKHTPEFNLTTNQKYIVAATVACIIAAGVAYKYGLFSSSKQDVAITAQEVQELVEGVVHNVSIPKQDQLNNIFAVLIRNGLDNIVVYNDHMFEVNDQFKVEIKGRSVKVSRS